MSDKNLQLDDFLPYRLSVASNLVSDAIASAYVRLFALSVAEWRLVAVIAEQNGLTQRELVTRTRMDKVTVSRATIALTERGLIERKPNPGDGRSQLLSLSAEGAELYGHVTPQALALEAQIFGELDQKELALFNDLLDRIGSAAKKLTDKKGTPG